MRSYYTGDPVRDAENYTADLEHEIEQERHSRVIKCTATIWMTVEHATEEEAKAEAYDFFMRMFKEADDAEFSCEEER